MWSNNLLIKLKRDIPLSEFEIIYNNNNNIYLKSNIQCT